MTPAAQPTDGPAASIEASPMRNCNDEASSLRAAARDITDSQQLAWRAKGLPLDGRFDVVTDVRNQRPTMFDAGFVTPVATLRASALEANLTAMARFSASSSVKLAPHGKTTMAPQLFDEQLRHGAWGITLATPWQVRVAREFGVPRILLANELVDPAALAWVASALSDQDFTLLSYVDDPDVVMWGAAVLKEQGAPRELDVLVEVGYPGGRTGTRSADAADQVAHAVASSRQHRLAGVAGYEGGFGHEASPQVVASVRDHLRDIRQTAERLDAAGLLEGDRVVLTAGGSSFFDFVVEELSGPLSSGRPVDTIVRSGGVISHDEGLYGEVSPFTRRTELRERAGGELQTAIEIWARVLSRPEGSLALIDAGKRDVPYDVQLPSIHRAYHAPGATAPSSPDEMERITDLEGWEFFDTDDQHGYIRLPADARLVAGDLVVLGITHPCTFFDKWRTIPVVDDAGAVIDVVHTYF